MSDPSTGKAFADNPEASRYEMPVEGGLAFVAYRLKDGVLTLDHAEVPSAVEGQGIGSRLVKATLDDVRKRGLKVIAHCGFVRAYMRRHPEYDDLVAR